MSRCKCSVRILARTGTKSLVINSERRSDACSAGFPSFPFFGLPMFRGKRGAQPRRIPARRGRANTRGSRQVSLRLRSRWCSPTAMHTLARVALHLGLDAFRVSHPSALSTGEWFPDFESTRVSRGHHVEVRTGLLTPFYTLTQNQKCAVKLLIHSFSKFTKGKKILTFILNNFQNFIHYVKINFKKTSKSFNVIG